VEKQGSEEALPSHWKISVGAYDCVMQGSNFPRKMFGIPYALHTGIALQEGPGERFDGPGKSWNFLSLKVWEPWW